MIRAAKLPTSSTFGQSKAKEIQQALNMRMTGAIGPKRTAPAAEAEAKKKAEVDALKGGKRKKKEVEVVEAIPEYDRRNLPMIAMIATSPLMTTDDHMIAALIRYDEETEASEGVWAASKWLNSLMVSKVRWVPLMATLMASLMASLIATGCLPHGHWLSPKLPPSDGLSQCHCLLLLSHCYLTAISMLSQCYLNATARHCVAQVITRALCIPSATIKPAFDFVRAMSEDDVRSKLEAAHLSGLADCLIQGLYELKKQKISGSAQLNDKFQATGKFQMSYGSLSLFYGGLESLIGSPQVIALRCLQWPSDYH